MEIIKHELKKIIEFSEKIGESLSEEQAFNFLILQYFYFNGSDISSKWVDIKSCITDGPNDGGIDFVYFDEDNSKIIIGQNKCVKQMSVNESLNEFNKVLRTIKDFELQKTGSYNNRLKEVLQDSLDRLTDENIGNIEFVFSCSSALNKNKVIEKIMSNESHMIEQITLNAIEDIETRIELFQSIINKVSEAKLKLDKPKNFLSYQSENMEGIFVNISSKSLTKIYNKYIDKGLFDLNIRKYIRNKLVDDSITDTIRNNSENFWFLNNGLTIACDEFSLDGDNIRLYDFSIVNGGQTTNLIGKSNTEKEFFIPCKIVRNLDGNDENFFSKIAEATNSQKPIQSKDLKSNSPEMRRLKALLKDYKIDLEIKRGDKKLPSSYTKIKNDELAQIILSFVNQKPGTSRSSKNSLFSNNKYYSLIFKQPYHKSDEKKKFLVDLIDLNTRFTYINDKLKKPGELQVEEQIILKNGKQILFSLFGVVYQLVNNDLTLEELKHDDSLLTTRDFPYNSLLSNYTSDDIDSKLTDLIKLLINILAKEYDNQYRNGKVTSVSNFFKTDKKYQDDILRKTFIPEFSRTRNYDELMEYASIFKR
ncbi:AIPR family protein [Turicibacter sanguinis]|uniref:AIPR family protein n=1 Tax=Turicibacter sanguinis TaxID=154288 RepID=UPI0018A0BCE1|nr:AIPR family protein [Turicibacter sanguinis]